MALDLDVVAVSKIALDARTRHRDHRTAVAGRRVGSTPAEFATDRITPATARDRRCHCGDR
ncbi:hypothetical protein [Rhodococcus wratislaviensis]|uniref:hypothetical protein n=1 Tax=Rhodococcus wratislaviensis TaxID=44752 RepID=UPI00055CB806|nr:hypothetical protein [Rhodococcus wratislaviensis]